MTESTNKKPLDYFAPHMGKYFIAGFVSYLVYAITGQSSMSDFISSDFLKAVIYILSTELVLASMACFYFRAVHRGSPDLKDLYNIFTEKSTQGNMLQVMATGLIITGIFNLITAVLDEIPVISWLSTIAVMAAGMLLKPVWYMFVANPHYPVKVYYVTAMKYMKGHLLKYIGIITLHSLAMVAVFLLLLVLGILGAVLSAVGVIFIMVLMDIKLALFMKGIIPEEWFAGQVQL